MRTFIVLEGPDGVGKTVLCKKLHEKLNEKGIKNKVFREPGGNKESELIRETIMQCGDNVSKLTQLLLFTASRNNLLEHIMKEEPEDEIIILDRFVLSSFAYQKNYAINKALYGMITDNYNIKLINLLLAVPYSLLKTRMDNRNDNEKNFLDDHTDCIDEYERIYLYNNKMNFQLIPGILEKVKLITNNEEDNIDKIMDVLKKYGIDNKEYDLLVEESKLYNINEAEYLNFSYEQLERLIEYYRIKEGGDLNGR